MTCPEPEDAINLAGMKNPLAYIGGGVIVAVMFLAVFVGDVQVIYEYIAVWIPESCFDCLLAVLNQVLT